MINDYLNFFKQKLFKFFIKPLKIIFEIMKKHEYIPFIFVSLVSCILGCVNMILFCIITLFTPKTNASKNI